MQDRDDALADLAAAQQQLAAVLTASPPKSQQLRMSRSDSEDYSGGVPQESPNGKGWPAAEEYLQTRRRLHPGSPAAEMHVITEAAAQQVSRGLQKLCSPEEHNWSGTNELFAADAVPTDAT